MNEPKEEQGPEKNRKKDAALPQLRTRLQEATVDAQFMMDYAATNTKSVIESDTLTSLITARQAVEKKRELTPDEETNFWLAYQKLWELVSPATAESIKANQVIEETFISKLIETFPRLSHWLGNGRTSKARKTVNGYIFFTVIVLALLLFFQIYWVVGNQLVQEMGAISQREEFLNTQLAQINSNSGSGSDTGASKAGYESELETANAKEERYAAILWLWSKPWNGYIEVVRKEHDPKFAPRFVDLEGQIAELEKKQRDDPDGSQEARINAQQKDLQTKLDEALKKQPPDQKEITDLQTQIKNISDISSLESQLADQTASLAEDQSQLEILSRQKQGYEDEVIALAADSNTTQENVKSLVAEQVNLQLTIDELNGRLAAIEKLNQQYQNLTPSPTQPSAILAADLATLPQDLQVELNAKPDLAGQLSVLNEYQADTQSQLDYLGNKNNDIENQLAQLEVDANNVQFQIDSLNGQIDSLDGQIADLNESIKKKQGNISEINSTIETLKSSIKEFQGEINAEEQQAIVTQRSTDLKRLKLDLYNLSLEEQEYLDRTDSRPAQLAGQFVLNILQSYFLPILYGLLGASTSVLRSLSRQIKDVIFSEKTRIQHLLSISLGALAGIVVGWFSFLIDGNSSFLGSVSPLAIAFLVGFNIDPFFSRMDLLMKSGEDSRPAASAPKPDARMSTPPEPKPAPSGGGHGKGNNVVE